MADEKREIDTPKAPPTKEEWRGVAHAYVDNNGWCAVCGRSEGWRAHPVKAVELTPRSKAKFLCDRKGAKW
jgi:hypothetical protein